MADTGIVRKVDDLGRIVIPMEMRRTLGIKVRDPLSISLEGDRIILRKFKEMCVVCGTTEDLLEVKDRKICSACAKAIKR